MLTTLRHSTGEMVHVAVLDGLEVIYVERLESHHLLPVFRQVGHRLPAHWTSSGKILLAALPRDELLDRLSGATLEIRTDRTIHDPALLLAELDRCAARGWASNVEEGHRGRDVGRGAAARGGRHGDRGGIGGRGVARGCTARRCGATRRWWSRRPR